MRTLYCILVSSLLAATLARAEDKPGTAPPHVARPARTEDPEKRSGPPMEPAKPYMGGQVVHPADLMKNKPVRNWPKVMRSWELDGGPGVSMRFHELVGTVPMHLHADAEERVVLIEGELQLYLGNRETRLKPGDFVVIPRGIKHKVSLAPGTRRALAVGVMSPPPDPRQTTWLEPEPIPAPAPAPASPPAPADKK